MTKLALNVTVARRGKIIVPTGFKNYDVAANSYVGCQFGCAYCYVRYFVKDPNHDWGEFVRLREHVHDKFPRELTAHAGQRLVLGTMTDPYQPLEREHRLTRAMLDHILAMDAPLAKVGIFTRSPIVLEDLDRVVRLPRRRVHYTITPYPPEAMRLIEPIAVRTDRRFATVAALKTAGVRCHVNVAPAIPLLSDDLVDEYAARLAEIGVDEYFTDPMQAYSDSWNALKAGLSLHPLWPEIEAIMTDRERYGVWKLWYRERWREAWLRVQDRSPNTLPIWSDHERRVWLDLRTGEPLDPRLYGDDQ